MEINIIIPLLLFFMTLKPKGKKKIVDVREYCNWQPFPLSANN